MKLFKNSGQEQAGWGDTIYLSNGDSLLRYSGWVMHCGGRSGLINDHGAPIFIDLAKCTFLQGPVSVAWMIKLFECSGHFQDCNFIGAGFRDFVQGVLRDGHPIYLSPTGPVGFTGCTFVNNAGNLQFVQRDYGYPKHKTKEPVVDKPPTGGVLISFQDCVLHNNSWNPAGNGGGGAAQIAAYNASEDGTEVRLYDCVISSNVKWTDKAASKSGPSARGAVTLWNECWEGLIHGTKKIGNITPNTTKHFSRFRVDGTTFRTTRPDRALINISGTKKIDMTDWKLDAILGDDDTDQLIGWPAMIDIDRNKDNPVRAHTINIEPVPGALGMIRHTLPDGEAIVTPVSEGYLWTSL